MPPKNMHEKVISRDSQESSETVQEILHMAGRFPHMLTYGGPWADWESQPLSRLHQVDQKRCVEETTNQTTEVEI